MLPTRSSLNTCLLLQFTNCGRPLVQYASAHASHRSIALSVLPHKGIQLPIELGSGLRTAGDALQLDDAALFGRTLRTPSVLPELRLGNVLWDDLGRKPRVPLLCTRLPGLCHNRNQKAITARPCTPRLITSNVKTSLAPPAGLHTMEASMHVQHVLSHVPDGLRGFCSNVSKRDLLLTTQPPSNVKGFNMCSR
eukprot:2841301-Amphidinium_carterae.1